MSLHQKVYCLTAGAMAQVVEHLPVIHKALDSIPELPKKEILS
jgi:hypothetical protein